MFFDSYILFPVRIIIHTIRPMDRALSLRIGIPLSGIIPVWWTPDFSP